MAEDQRTGTRLGALAAALGVGSALALSALAALGWFWGPVPDPARRVLEWWTLAWVGFPLAGALIATRRPSTRIGWALIGICVSMAVSRVAGMYLVRAHVTLAGELPAGELVIGALAVLGALGDGAAFLLVGVVLVLFPSDRLGAAWRRALPVVVAAGLVGAISNPTVVLDDDSAIANPLRIGWAAGLAPILEAGQLAVVVFVIAALVDLVRRSRRADQTVRQQLKWLAYPAAVFLVAAAPFAVFVYDEAVLWMAVAWAALFVVCLNGMAAAIGLAVLRYRLFEIDRLISRTLSYALLTGLLVAGYAGAVVLLGGLLSPLTRESEVAVAASTLLVAASFQPLRRRVQGLVDRRFNRARYDAQRTVEGFALRMREEIDLDELSAELLGVVTRTVEPEELQIWLAPRNGAGTVTPYP
jgi:hypothetical protein